MIRRKLKEDHCEKLCEYVQCLNMRATSAHLPIYLSLLVDDAMGFLSGYLSIEPQLSYVDDCTQIRKRV